MSAVTDNACCPWSFFIRRLVSISALRGLAASLLDAASGHRPNGSQGYRTISAGDVTRPKGQLALAPVHVLTCSTMPNVFTCFSSSNRLQTPTNPSSATEGVRKRLAALSADEVRPLLDRSILDVLKSAADHIEGNRHAARHVMDCLQGKRAPDHADTWLQGMGLDRQHTRICATVFHSNLYGRAEPADKSLAKIACVVERLNAQMPKEISFITEQVSPPEIAPDVNSLIADMVTRSVSQAQTVDWGQHRDDRETARPHLQPFLETRWKAVLDTCLTGERTDILERIQTLNMVPPTDSPDKPWKLSWHQINIDALLVAIQHHKHHPQIVELLDRLRVNLRHCGSHLVPEWGESRLIDLGRTDRATFPWLAHSIFLQDRSMQELPRRMDMFLAAQNEAAPGNHSQTQWQQMCAEAKDGRTKVGHYIWFAYPQLGFTQDEIGIVPSENAQKFGMKNLYEAMAYLEHPILGDRLRTLCRHLQSRSDITAESFFRGDACKFQSCLTLFALAIREARQVLKRSEDITHAATDEMRWEQDEALFLDCLDRFFSGQADKKTESRLHRELQKMEENATLHELWDETARRLPTTRPKRNPAGT